MKNVFSNKAVSLFFVLIVSANYAFSSEVADIKYYHTLDNIAAVMKTTYRLKTKYQNVKGAYTTADSDCASALNDLNRQIFIAERNQTVSDLKKAYDLIFSEDSGYRSAFQAKLHCEIMVNDPQFKKSFFDNNSDLKYPYLYYSSSQ